MGKGAVLIKGTGSAVTVLPTSRRRGDLLGTRGHRGDPARKGPLEPEE